MIHHGTVYRKLSPERAWLLLGLLCLRPSMTVRPACEPVIPCSVSVVPSAVPKSWVGTDTGGTTSGNRDTLGVPVPAPPLHVLTWLNQPDSASPVQFGDGHVYLLDFTMYWCEACPSTYGALKDIAKHYAARGVRVIMVTGVGEKDLDFVRQYFATEHMTLPIAVGSHNAAAYHAQSYPTVLLIDQRGVIQHRWTGGKVIPTFTSDQIDVAYEREITIELDRVLTPSPSTTGRTP